MTLVGVSVACQNGRHETCRGHEERNVYHPCACACHAPTWRETNTDKPIAENDLPPAVRAFAQRVSAAYGDDSNVGIQLTEQERVWLVERNVALIEAVPAAVWESSVADPVYGPPRREWALYWARKGYDVYCYKSGGGGGGSSGIWNLWLAGERIELGREGSAE